MQTTFATTSRPTRWIARSQTSTGRRDQRWGDFLAVVVGLFILQTGLAPYDFLTSHTESASRTLFSISIHRLTRPDVLSNIFLYLPFGLLACVALTARIRRRGAAISLAIACAAILSVGIEWIQSFSITRVSSLIDVAANVLGAGIGVLISLIVGPLLPKLRTAARTELVLRPHGTVVKAYAALLCIAAAAPFDLSFDVGHLRKSWKSASASLTQFSHSAVEPPLPSSARFASQGADYDRWVSQARWARCGAEGVSFAVFGWLAMAWLRREYAFGRWTSAGLCLWIGILFSAGLSVLQLPVLSRGFDVLDVVFRVLGLLVACGAGWLNGFGNQATAEKRADVAVAGRVQTVRLLCCATALYIAYTGLIPVGVDFSRPSQVLSWSTLVPFSTYPIGRFDTMMCDAMEKLGAFMFLAFLFSMLRSAKRTGEPRREIVRTVSLCAGLATLIEAAQSVIPPRTPSLTDVVLAATGAGFGCVLQDRIASFWLDASRRRTKLAATAPASTPPARVFTPLDELIASLAEPKQDAPTETESPARPTPGPRTT